MMFGTLMRLGRSSGGVKHAARRDRKQRRPARRPGVEVLEERCLLSTDPVLQFNEAVLAAVRADRPAGAFVTRDLAIVHAAIYDAVNSIEQTHTPFHVQVDAPPDASPEAAAAAAGLVTGVNLFPDQQALFTATYQVAITDIPDGPAKAEGIAVGRYVGQQTLIWRSTDGSNAVVDYTPGNNPGDWRPTPPGFQPAQTPQWPFVTPFAIESGSQFRSPPPPALTSPEYTAAFNEVKDLGRADSTVRTPEQTEIAQFWEAKAGTPTIVGYFNEIADTVAQARGNTLDENARLFAQLNVSLADEWIALFDTKYTYNLWRPVTAIQLADQTGNPDTIADPNWLPLLNTAPHPSYGSAHGATSATAAAVLADFFGTDNVSFSLTSEDLPGVVHAFPSFSAAAAQATQSVVYAGVHFSTDNAASQAQSRSVVKFIAGNFFQPLPTRPGRESMDAVFAQLGRPSEPPLHGGLDEALEGRDRPAQTSASETAGSESHPASVATSGPLESMSTRQGDFSDLTDGLTAGLPEI